MATVVTVQIGDTPWCLRGILFTAGRACQHCGKITLNHFQVTDTSTGRELTIGVSCGEKVTGYPLSRSQATHLIRQAAHQAAIKDRGRKRT